MKTTDDYFMEHVFLSELWLFLHMKRVFGDTNDLKWKKQINDEKKHSAMARGALKKEYKKRNIFNYSQNIKNSVEKCIYEDIGGIEVDKLYDAEEFSAFAYVVERRALLLYRWYVKHGNNEYYKKICKRIIDDEEDHKQTHTEKQNKHLARFKDLDSKIYKKLNEVYSKDGTPYFNNIVFWKDMFGGELRFVTVS